MTTACFQPVLRRGADRAQHLRQDPHRLMASHPGPVHAERRRRGEEGGHANEGAAPTRGRKLHAVPRVSEASIICQVTPKSHGCVDSRVRPPRSRGSVPGHGSYAARICLLALDESVIRRRGP